MSIHTGSRIISNYLLHLHLHVVLIFAVNVIRHLAAHTYDRSKPSHLKGEIAADTASRTRDEGNLAGDAAFLSREEASPDDPDVNEESFDEEDDDVEQVDDSAVEGYHAFNERQVHERGEPGYHSVSSEATEVVESGKGVGFPGRSVLSFTSLAHPCSLYCILSLS